MNCPNCGSQIVESATFCSECGANVASYDKHSSAVEHACEQHASNNARTSSTSFNFARSFSFVFQDKTWAVKCLLLFFILLIPIIGFFVAIGYMSKVAQNTVRSDDRQLPAIDFANQLLFGFYYSLSVILFMILIYAIYLIVLPMTPLFVRDTSFIPMCEPVNNIALIVYFVIGTAFTIYALSASAFAFSANKPWAIFSFKLLGPIVVKNIHYSLLVFFFTYILILLGQMGIICIIGVVFSIPLSLLMIAHLYGQVGRRFISQTKDSDLLSLLVSSEALSAESDQTEHMDSDKLVSRSSHSSAPNHISVKRRNTIIIVAAVCGAAIIIAAFVLFVLFVLNKTTQTPAFELIKTHVIYENDVTELLGYIERYRVQSYSSNSFNHNFVEQIGDNGSDEFTIEWNISLRGSKKNGTLYVYQKGNGKEIVFEEVMLTVDKQKHYLTIESVSMDEYHKLKQDLEARD